MSRTVSLSIYDKKKLFDELNKKKGITDKKLLRKVLKQFGHFAGDKYFLLNNEHWEDYNPYYKLGATIDYIFNVKDSFNVYLWCESEEFFGVTISNIVDGLGIDYKKFEKYLEE